MRILSQLIFKFNTKNSIFNFAYRKQLLATLTVCIIAFSHGLTVGWASPTLRKIMSDQTPLSFPVTVDEVSWIGSLLLFGAIFGDVVQCCLVNIVGRKWCINVMTLPQILAWFLILYAASVEYLYGARVVLGFAAAASTSILPLYLGDISNRNVRGSFISFYVVAISFGTLIGFILASALSYHTYPWIVIPIPLVFLALFAFFPETPPFLLRRKSDKAFEAFKFYGNYGSNNALCLKEFNDMKNAIEASEVKGSVFVHEFFKPAALRTYPTIIFVLLLMHFSGLSSFISYMSEVFAISGAPFDPDISTIVVGVVQVLGNIAATICIDQYGRRILMIISAVGVAIGLFAYGCYTFVTSGLSPPPFNWIPLVCMTIIIFIGSIGVWTLPHVILVEILPVTIRAPAVPIFLCLLGVMGFAATKLFPICLYGLGITITLWSCGVLTVCFLTYLIIFLPETKGKSIVSD